MNWRKALAILGIAAMPIAVMGADCAPQAGGGQADKGRPIVAAKGGLKEPRAKMTHSREITQDMVGWWRGSGLKVACWWKKVAINHGKEITIGEGQGILAKVMYISPSDVSSQAQWRNNGYCGTWRKKGG